MTEQIRWQLEPIAAWPWNVTEHPRRSPFDSPWSATLGLLIRELQHLAVDGAVAIRAFVTEGDIRRDGMLRATARPSKPGVAISFTCKHGPLTYPCDRFTHWQDNVRAVALALEALRKVDRYGVGRHGEQYAGWRAIEAGPGALFATPGDALVWLRGFVQGREGIAPSTARGLLRRASVLAHPDRGGDRADWDRVDAARAVLGGAR